MGQVECLMGEFYRSIGEKHTDIIGGFLLRLTVVVVNFVDIFMFGIFFSGRFRLWRRVTFFQQLKKVTKKSRHYSYAP